MREFTKDEQKVFNEIMQNIGKAMIFTMKKLEIPNFIKATFECDGYKYELNFNRKQLHDQDT